MQDNIIYIFFKLTAQRLSLQYSSNTRTENTESDCRKAKVWLLEIKAKIYFIEPSAALRLQFCLELNDGRFTQPSTFSNNDQAKRKVPPSIHLCLWNFVPSCILFQGNSVSDNTHTHTI